jgi:hypothetical protein
MFVVLCVDACGEGDNLMPDDSSDSRFKAGQVWQYETRPHEKDSTITILKVESVPNFRQDTLVYVSVQGLSIKTPDKPDTPDVITTITPKPFSEEAIERSVLKMIKDNAPLPEYEEAYDKWRREFVKGNDWYFAITVAEVVEIFEQDVNK